MRFIARMYLGALLACTSFGSVVVADTLADVQTAFEQRFNGVEVGEVRKAPLPGLFEVQVGMEVVYVDEAVNYVFQGSLIDVESRTDLTEARKQKLAEVPFESLPVELAVKVVRGSGERKVAIFEDPNCPYCKKLHNTLKEMDNITIYSFLFPVLSKDSVTKARDIWCADSPAQTWQDWMLEDSEPETARCDDDPAKEIIALGQKLQVRGTPAIFFEDGSRLSGAVPLAKIETQLKAASSAAADD